MTGMNTAEGDPGKMAYLRNPNWTPKLFSVVGSGVKRRDFCPGCRWPGENRAHEDSPFCAVYQIRGLGVQHMEAD
jgi:hypothetical protein